MMTELFKFLLSLILPLFSERRKIRLAVHRARFLHSNRDCYFVNVTNLSRSREIEITHIWFDCTPQVHCLPPERPLPKRLKPDETWETWVEARLLRASNDGVFELARARLSTGVVIKSKRNKNVPHEGFVPGEQRGVLYSPPITGAYFPRETHHTTAVRAQEDLHIRE